MLITKMKYKSFIKLAKELDLIDLSHKLIRDFMKLVVRIKKKIYDFVITVKHPMW
jgi:hypothetical protein